MGTQTFLAALLCITAAPLVSASEPSIPAEIDKAFAEYVALPDQLEPILAEVKDKASADKAADRLFTELQKVYDARSALQKITDLPPNVAEELKKKYEKTMRTRWGAIYEHIFRLQKVRCYDSIPFFKQFHTLCMMLEQ